MQKGISVALLQNTSFSIRKIMLPYDVFVSIGLLPQLIGVAPEKAIKLTVRTFFFFSWHPFVC